MHRSAHWCKRHRQKTWSDKSLDRANIFDCIKPALISANQSWNKEGVESGRYHSPWAKAGHFILERFLTAPIPETPGLLGSRLSIFQKTIPESVHGFFDSDHGKLAERFIFVLPFDHNCLCQGFVISQANLCFEKWSIELGKSAQQPLHTR